MSNRNQAPSAGAKDDKSNTRKPEMRVMEVDRATGILMMAHYEDAVLNPDHPGNTNNSPELLREQANPTTRPTSASQATKKVRRSLRKCSDCHCFGHRQHQCPRLTCKHCGIVGHLAVVCPEKSKQDEEKHRKKFQRRHNRYPNRTNKDAFLGLGD